MATDKEDICNEICDYPVKRFKEDDNFSVDQEEIGQIDSSEILEHKHKTRIKDCSEAQLILKIEEKQSHELLELNYSSSKVTHIYNPLDYASETHSYYVRQYGNGPKRIMFLGMNPGPFGMAQNGVPFGDVSQVKDWLQIQGHVEKPSNEHPKRPIVGLSCTRNEISGTRFWGLIKSIWKTPEEFFRTCYVHNYCPLCFMTSTGRNVTPPSLKASERTKLESICDLALLEVVKLLKVEVIVCVGKYVEQRTQRIVKELKIQVGSITHPSPINPNANKGDWITIATQQLYDMNVISSHKH